MCAVMAARTAVDVIKRVREDLSLPQTRSRAEPDHKLIARSHIRDQFAVDRRGEDRRHVRERGLLHLAGPVHFLADMLVLSAVALHARGTGARRFSSI